MAESSPISMRWVATNATGVVLPHPAVIYYLRLAADTGGNQVIIVVLRDSLSDVSNATSPPVIMALTTVNGVADDWPKTVLRFAVENGLTAEFRGTGSALLTVGWRPG